MFSLQTKFLNKSNSSRHNSPTIRPPILLHYKWAHRLAGS